MDPLKTRSLPWGLWQFVPESVASLDRRLQRWMETSVDPSRGVWPRVHWLTEMPRGMETGFLVVLAAGVLYGTLARDRGPAVTPLPRKRRVSDAIIRLLSLIPFFFMADLACSLIKLAVGRIKPHVTFYNPNMIPVLAFPSGHAFNTAFLLALAWFASPGGTRRKWAGFFVFLSVVCVLIGLSRIFLGQHHPLDVLAGWVIGFFLGRGLAPAYRGTSLWTMRKYAGPRQFN